MDLVWALNPVTPKSDYDVISLHIIIPESNIRPGHMDKVNEPPPTEKALHCLNNSSLSAQLYREQHEEYS